MAYFIFLKSLTSLGEFRKNPHVKIPPKFPCANFQSIGIFKNSIFITKEILFDFRPEWPGRPSQPTRPFGPSGQAGRASPPGPKRPGRPKQPTRPRAARKAEPAHQAKSPPPPSPSSLNAPVVPLPPLVPPRHWRRATPLPRHGATAMNAPPSLTRSGAFTRT
jgi:hypothetical protein